MPIDRMTITAGTKYAPSVVIQGKAQRLDKSNLVKQTIDGEELKGIKIDDNTFLAVRKRGDGFMATRSWEMELISHGENAPPLEQSNIQMKNVSVGQIHDGLTRTTYTPLTRKTYGQGPAAVTINKAFWDKYRVDSQSDIGRQLKEAGLTYKDEHALNLLLSTGKLHRKTGPGDDPNRRTRLEQLLDPNIREKKRQKMLNKYLAQVDAARASIAANRHDNQAQDDQIPPPPPQRPGDAVVAAGGNQDAAPYQQMGDFPPPPPPIPHAELNGPQPENQAGGPPAPNNDDFAAHHQMDEQNAVNDVVEEHNEVDMDEDHGNGGIAQDIPLDVESLAGNEDQDDDDIDSDDDILDDARETFDGQELDVLAPQQQIYDAGLNQNDEEH